MLTTKMTYPAATSTLGVDYLNSPDFERTGLPFSEVVRAGDMLYLSGQMGTLPGTLTLVDGGTVAEARQALGNIERALQAHGYNLRQVVKCTVMLAGMSDWPDFNAVYREFFKSPYPARSAFGVTALALGGKLEIDVIATAGDSASAST